MQAICYLLPDLVMANSGHRLYGQRPHGVNKKNSKGYVKSRKPPAAVNLVEDNNPKEPTADSIPSAPVLTSAQYAENMKLLGANNTHNSNVPAANMAGNVPLKFGNDWIIDMGANEHLTGCPSLLQSAKSVADSSSSVMLPTGNKLFISHIGSVALSPSITLPNVLRVPRFQFKFFVCFKIYKNSLIVSRSIQVFTCFKT